MQQILTPLTTKAFVQRVREAGFIEHEENYPVVAEVPGGYLFVCVDTNDGDWIVSKFWFDNNDWNYRPMHECETFAEAFAFYNLTYTREFNKVILKKG